MHEAVLAMGCDGCDGCDVSGNITEGWAGTSCQRSLACRGETTRISEKLGHCDGGAVNAPGQWQTNRQPCQHDNSRLVLSWACVPSPYASDDLTFSCASRFSVANSSGVMNHLGFKGRTSKLQIKPTTRNPARIYMVWL